MPKDDYPTFCGSCHEPRNSAELDNAGRCHDCRERFIRPEALAPIPAHCLDCGTHLATRIAPHHCRPATVKRYALDGTVIDTMATETELNGFRPTQGALL